MNEAQPNQDSLPELVRFDKVTKSFGTGPEARVAIQDVSFVIHDLPKVANLKEQFPTLYAGK